MFFLMLRQSFVKGWRRKALATATIVLAASLITALMNISIDVGDKMSKEMKSYGANINLVPKSESISLEIGGVDYNPLEGQVLIDENDLPKIKEIFWANNIVGYAPFLRWARSWLARPSGCRFWVPISISRFPSPATRSSALG